MAKDQRGEARRKYVENGGIACPACGSQDIVGQSIIIDNGYALQSVDCNNCSSSWTDRYRLVSVDRFETTRKRLNTSHTQVLHGKCPICLHYGSDCTGSKPDTTDRRTWAEALTKPTRRHANA